MANHSKARADAYTQGALMAALLIGIAFRTVHLFLVGFSAPFDLGGLFHQMSIEIIKNGFALPDSIPYYFPGGLPFAYPPLPFYIQAIVIQAFSPKEFIASNALPPFFSILSLFAFRLLAQKAIPQKAGVLGAALAFSIMPIAFCEQIEAMGLAESIGTLFLILYLWSILWAMARPLKGWIVPGIFLGLCIMSSPGSIYASLLISMLLFSFSALKFLTGKNREFLAGSAITGLTGLAISSPTWGTVIARHGIEIFTHAFSAQHASLLQAFIQRAGDLQLIHASPYWNILFLFGFASALIKKQHWLILFSILLMLMPREAWIMAIPASLLAGYGAICLLELLRMIPKVRHNILIAAVTWTMILFFGIDAWFSLNSLIDGDFYDISPIQIQELRMVHQSNLIPGDQHVVVLGNWGLIEWSPAILERTVINNPFGLEWLPERREEILLLNESLLQPLDPDAMMAAIREAFNDIGRVYVIGSRERLIQLNDPVHAKTAAFETLQEFDDLGVGILTVQN